MLPTYFKMTSEINIPDLDRLNNINANLSTVETQNPEDTYAIALTNGFISTFKRIAQQSNFRFSTLKVLTTVGIDHNKNGNPWLATANFKVFLSGVKSQEAALQLLQKTTESCVVLNSVVTAKHFQFEILA